MHARTHRSALRCPKSTSMLCAHILPLQRTACQRKSHFDLCAYLLFMHMEHLLRCFLSCHLSCFAFCFFVVPQEAYFASELMFGRNVDQVCRFLGFFWGPHLAWNWSINSGGLSTKTQPHIHIFYSHTEKHLHFIWAFEPHLAHTTTLRHLGHICPKECLSLTFEPLLTHKTPSSEITQP